MLNKGFIRSNVSYSEAIMPFIKKKDDMLRLRIDYRELNKTTKQILIVYNRWFVWLFAGC